MGDFEKLLVFQKAHKVALKCHKAAKAIRGAEYVSLRSQMIRSAFSVPANIVEGNGFQTTAQYASHVKTAMNSNDELKYHIITARDMPVMSQARAAHLMARINEVGKMLKGLHDYLEKKRKQEEKKRIEEEKKAI